MTYTTLIDVLKSPPTRVLHLRGDSGCRCCCLGKVGNGSERVCECEGRMPDAADVCLPEDDVLGDDGKLPY